MKQSYTIQYTFYLDNIIAENNEDALQQGRKLYQELAPKPEEMQQKIVDISDSLDNFPV